MTWLNISVYHTLQITFELNWKTSRYELKVPKIRTRFLITLHAIRHYPTVCRKKVVPTILLPALLPLFVFPFFWPIDPTVNECSFTSPLYFRASKPRRTSLVVCCYEEFVRASSLLAMISHALFKAEWYSGKGKNFPVDRSTFLSEFQVSYLIV